MATEGYDPEAMKMELLTRLYDETFLFVDQAIISEQNDAPFEALHLYERALSVIDQSLDIPIDDLQGSPCFAKAQKTNVKLKRIRQQVIFRIREIQMSASSSLPPSAPPATDLPPSYEDATTNGNGARAVQEALNEILESPTYDETRTELPSNAEVLFSIPNQVQIFYISSDGNVSAPSYPSALHVFRFKDVPKDEEAPAFIQVGSWVYPLVPGKSPVLQSSLGSYMFPDLDDSIAGNAIGLILPPTVTDDEKRHFEAILDSLTSAYQQQQNLEKYEEYRKFSSELSSGLVKGADMIGRGMLKASIKTSHWMHLGTERLKERMNPDAQPYDVDPSLQQGLRAAKWATTGACKVSGYLVSKVGTATVSLGRFLAPHVQKTSTKALSHIRKQDEQESEKQYQIAAEIASGSIQAFSTIYVALENSSKILAQNVANNTVTIVQHKYGMDAGAATGDALSTIGNTYMTVYNAGTLGPKGLANKTVRNAGKVAVGVPDEFILTEPRKRTKQGGAVGGPGHKENNVLALKVGSQVPPEHNVQLLAPSGASSSNAVSNGSSSTEGRSNAK